VILIGMLLATWLLLGYLGEAIAARVQVRELEPLVQSLAWRGSDKIFSIFTCLFGLLALTVGLLFAFIEDKPGAILCPLWNWPFWKYHQENI